MPWNFLQNQQQDAVSLPVPTTSNPAGTTPKYNYALGTTSLSLINFVWEEQ